MKTKMKTKMNTELDMSQLLEETPHTRFFWCVGALESLIVKSRSGLEAVVEAGEKLGPILSAKEISGAWALLISIGGVSIIESGESL